jgi:hypothetical protein
MKNSRFHLYATSLLVCASASLNATAAEASALTEDSARPPYLPWTVGVEAGTTGFGGSGSWRFANHWGLRFGGDFLEDSDNNMEIKGIHYDTKLRLLSEPLTLDIYPWHKHSFHISLGMMFNQNQLTGTATDSGTITIGGIEYPTPLVGTLNMKIVQQPVNPYLSIGGNFFYFDRAHHWALGGELGVVYAGDATASLNRTGPPSAAIDAAMVIEQGRLQDYADRYRWYPVLKLAVSFSF